MYIRQGVSLEEKHEPQMVAFLLEFMSYPQYPRVME